MNGVDAPWHEEAIDSGAKRALEDLRAVPDLATFYLAGGTGLALKFGHRISVDLDFFRGAVFSEDAFIQRLQHLAEFALVSKSPATIHAVVRTVKISFMSYDYPVLFPLQEFRGTHVADPRDIACMKIAAIASRGAKRDFVDLYFACREFGLGGLLGWFTRKFSKTNYSTVHVLKSLCFFDEAERDPMPHMLTPVPWAEMKQYLTAETLKMM